MATTFPRARVIAILSAAFIVVVGTVACASRPPVEEAPASSPRPTQPDSTQPTPVPSATEARGIITVPLDVSCDEVITPAELYDFNPNLSSDPGAEVSPVAARALAYGGVACTWTNQTSRGRFAVALVKLADDSIEVVREELMGSGQPAGLPGWDAYFRQVGQSGVVDVLRDPYWVSFESVDFLSAADVEPLVSIVLDHLR